ncbi:MAG: 1,4-dihydroxy-2-naphthoate octaprenyltransferase [Neisseria sp.]|uniref:1,4-dihydroxy-2-naphthoate octaprenyltransferase n=1 Tax=Neisseria sp. TaxID=192066 RepID=UPI0026DABFB1|nr:1,4-dihydroxy-2-naphthoate octaprenyltransferase [Neisseria sp.]MDO4640363.1 1,4-dihydroxy-2-naphthoate octaprenyltransferase [Neisseria sp.]
MSLKYWLVAARLRTLPLAAASVLCGALSAKLTGQYHATVMLLCLVTAVALQVFSNLANDYGDACHCADTADKQPPRMVSGGFISRAAMKRALLLTGIVCCVCGIGLLAQALPLVQADGWGGWLLWLALGCAAIAAAFAYTAGNKPYGYAGFGDLAVLVFFGWLGVLGSEYLQTGALAARSWLPATALGLWCVMVLNLNNMRDIESDGAAGKMTVVVRLGLPRAKFYHLALTGSAWGLWLVWLACRLADSAVYMGLNVILTVASLSHACQVWRACDADLDRLLPQWSGWILMWVLCLWLAVWY